MVTEQFANNPSSTLTGAITAGSTSLTVASAAAFSTGGNFRVLIDSEILKVTGVAGSTFTVERGAEATSAAAHSAGATVTQVLTAGALNTALYEDVRIKTAAAVQKVGDLTDKIVHNIVAADTHINSQAWDGQTIITGTFPSGKIWQSMDRGMTWAEVEDLVPATIEDPTSFVSTGPGEFICAASEYTSGLYIYTSTDSGLTWTKSASTIDAATLEGASLCYAGGTLLAGSYGANAGNAKILRSTDKGATWSAALTLPTKQTIRQIAYVDIGTFIACASWYSGGANTNECVFYRSVNAGVTWTPVLTVPSLDVYSILGLGNGVVLVGTHPAGILYRSSNSGATFTSINLGVGPGQSQVMGLVRMGEKVLAFVHQNGNAQASVYASLDEGVTWTLVGQIDPAYHAHNPLAIDHRTLIAGASPTTGTGTKIIRYTFHG